MVETITSAANPLVKEIRRAMARGGLTRQGWCVAETFHLFEEALRSGAEIAMVVAAESARDSIEARVGGIKIAILPDALFQSISATETAQGVMALVKPREWTLADLLSGRALIVVLDELQDPGNAGAIVRAAEALGATGAVFPKGTVSPYNPKTLRASAGSLFRLPVLHGMDSGCARSQLLENGVELFAAVPAHAGALPVDAADLTGKCAIVIGNEARGVSETWRSSAREISIPTTGVESLNAAVAAGILLYEARRQRNSPA
jgi:RNA methyltransferase, TrmH family